MALDEVRCVPDEELVERIRGGDRAAFDILYQRYFSRVYNYLNRRLNIRADAEETTQEVFVNLFSSLGTFEGQAPFGAWVFGIARRTLANRFKKRRIESISLAEYEMESIPASSAGGSHLQDPLAVYECQERIDRMARVAESLTDEQRTVFELHHLQHRPIRELARIMRKSEDAIKSHLYRARKLIMAG